MWTTEILLNLSESIYRFYGKLKIKSNEIVIRIGYFETIVNEVSTATEIITKK